ncbi:MAG: restriction endonuclease subunit S [Myxococcota bacterium]
MRSEAWSEVQLGSLLRERPRNGYSPVESATPTDTLMLGLGCLMPDGFVPRQLKFAPAGDPTVKSALLTDGDVLVSRSNTRDLVGLAGRYRDVGRPCSYPDLMMRLRPTGALNPRFLELVLLNSKARRWFQANASGTSGSMVKITADVVCATPVPVVSPVEQARITEVLDTVDDTIRETEQVIAKLEQIKRGLLQDLLTRGIDDNGEIRDPEQHPEQFKDSAVGRIPTSWTSKSLRELAEVRSGIAKNEGVPVSNPVEVAYLRVANVQDGYLDLSEMKTLRMTRSEFQNYRVLPGDVLMNEGGDRDKLGRGAIWRGEFDPCVHQNHVFVVRCGPGLRPEFLDAWTGGTVAKRYFIVAGKQSTNLASINKTSIGRLPVAVPLLAEQDRSIAALDVVAAKLASETSELRKFRLLKKGLMDDLLTGRVRVPVSR